MKILFCSVFFFCCNTAIFAQVKLLRDNCESSKTGFLFYEIDSTTIRPFVSFVPLKDQKTSISFGDFETEKLAAGYMLTTHYLYYLDTLDKYSKKYQPDNHKFCVVVIPVRMDFTCYPRSSFLASDIRKHTKKAYYKLSKRMVRIKQIHGMITQICGIYAVTTEN